MSKYAHEEMASIMAGVVACGTKTDVDYDAIKDFKEALRIASQALKAGLSRKDAIYYAHEEVYGKGRDTK